MADTQVVTGLAILSSGYFSRSGLSALHWKMIVYLAWFSCATHLSALTFLRNYLINHPGQRRWRLASMFTLLLILIVAMIPTGHFNWDALIHIPYMPTTSMDAAPSANATCYFNTNFQDNAYQAKNAMVISILLLALGFTTRLFKLHHKVFCFKIESISRYIVEIVLYSASFFHRFFGTSTVEDRFVSNMVVAAHMTVCVWIDLYTSMASDVRSSSLILVWIFYWHKFEVYWLIVSLTWGTIKITDLLTLLDRSKKQDNTWTFGQVLPVVLLSLPMISLLEHFLNSVFSGLS